MHFRTPRCLTSRLTPASAVTAQSQSSLQSTKENSIYKRLILIILSLFDVVQHKNLVSRKMIIVLKFLFRKPHNVR